MATIRSQCVDSAVALLNGAGGPTGLQTVQRCQLTTPTLEAGKAWIFVRSGEDEVSQVGGSKGPIRQHHFDLIVDCIAPGDAATPADKAVDPLIAWCVKKLDASTLGGLALVVEEKKTVYVYKQGDYGTCRARVTFIVRHTTKSGDAELKT